MHLLILIQDSPVLVTGSGVRTKILGQEQSHMKSLIWTPVSWGQTRHCTRQLRKLATDLLGSTANSNYAVPLKRTDAKH